MPRDLKQLLDDIDSYGIHAQKAFVQLKKLVERGAKVVTFEEFKDACKSHECIDKAWEKL